MSKRPRSVAKAHPSLDATATIFDAIEDVFSEWFRKPASWAAWRAFLASLFALPMTAEQLATYRQSTGRTEPPTAPADEAWLICGRRAGKSFILSVIAIFLACFRSYAEYLQPGERATVMVIARDRSQARVILRYVRGLLNGVPMLKQLIEHETAERFDLSNSVTIEIATASYKSIRGYTVCAALCDEIAFWPCDDSAEPDREILDALRPAMVTIPGAMMLCASSPYARRGALWDAFRKHHGRDGDPVLVWKAPTRVMNPSVPQRVIDEATERDPASAAAEYMAEFRVDVESYISREVVDACVAPGCFERAPVPGLTYSAFVDPSGGSSDSMTIAIAHRDGDGVVLDAVRERRPRFSPDDVVQEFAGVLKAYGVHRVVGDRYGGEWPRERFRVHGITYDVAEKSKSDIYRDLLPLLNATRVELLDHARLVAQLCGLERRVARGGRDSIDHAPGAHDDCANAAAGVIVSLMTTTSADAWISFYGDLARKAQLGQDAKKTDRPLAVTHVKDIDPDNTVADAYARVMGRELTKKEKCEWCGHELKSSRTTDGEHGYHEDCYHEMLSKSTA